jgi:hypothetical protein
LVSDLLVPQAKDEAMRERAVLKGLPKIQAIYPNSTITPHQVEGKGWCFDLAWNVGGERAGRARLWREEVVDYLSNHLYDTVYVRHDDLSHA